MKPIKKGETFSDENLGAKRPWNGLDPALLEVIWGQKAAGDIAADPAVEYVEPDRIRHITIDAPNDSRYGDLWHLVRIRAQQAWQYLPGRYLTASLNLNRVRVAVLDTGADCTHPDFANAGSLSTDSASGGQLNWLSSVALLPTVVPSPACPWQDDNGHG